MDDEKKLKRIEQVIDDFDSDKIFPEGKKAPSFVAVERIKEILWG